MKPNFRKEQDKEKSRMKRRGFSHITTDAQSCYIMQRLSVDGFVEQVRIDIFGRTVRYKPWKPSPLEQATLNKVKEKYSYYDRGY